MHGRGYERSPAPADTNKMAISSAICNFRPAGTEHKSCLTHKYSYCTNHESVPVTVPAEGTMVTTP